MKKFAFIIALLCTSTIANAQLISRLDGQAYYDTVTELTWLSNANLAGTTMEWATAMNWVSNLEINGITGWVLPATIQPDVNCSHSTGSDYYGYGCSSPLAIMFEEVLGGTAGTALSDNHNANYDLFTNIQERSPYWSSTELDGNQYISWAHFFQEGSQGLHFKANIGYVWAVYEGDVANVSSVPVPAATWLFMSGLIGMVFVARRRAAAA